MGYGPATLKDVTATLTGDEKKRADIIVNMMTQTNECMNDMVLVQCNSGTVHKTTIKTGMPSPAWRMLYKGVPPTKSEHAQISEPTGMLMAFSIIDHKLYELHGKDSNYVMEESQDAVESINQSWADAFFYGDLSKNPAAFNGLNVRSGKCNGKIKTKSSYNVISPLDPTAAPLSGKKDLTSIYVVGWSTRGVCGIYPGNGQSTIKLTSSGYDGKVYEKDEDKNDYPVIKTRFEVDVGLAVRDWRFFARGCNISMALVEDGTIDLYTLLKQLYYRVRKYKNSAKFAIYVNGDLFFHLDQQAEKKVSNQLTYQTVDGKDVLTYRGIPIRECEAIRTDEDVVTVANAKGE